MLHSLSRHLHLFTRLLYMHNRANVEYRADFWLKILGLMLRNVVGVVFIYALFANVNQLVGWVRAEVMMLYALAVAPRGLLQLFCNGAWQLRNYIHRGQFDQMLTRPLSPVFQALTLTMSIEGLGTLAVGVAAFVSGYSSLGLSWGVGQWLLLLLVLLGGTILVASLDVGMHALVFWSPAAARLQWFVEQSTEFAQYPVGMYHRALQLMLSTVLPFAFISYYPLAYLLGKPEGSVWLALLSPLVGVAFALLMSRVWHAGVQRYQSSGS
jgi:ABC-2 type transport system permease protein